jgi:hypothetical protein
MGRRRRRRLVGRVDGNAMLRLYVLDDIAGEEQDFDSLGNSQE